MLRYLIRIISRFTVVDRNFDQRLIIEILTFSYFPIVCNQPRLSENCKENHQRLHSKWYYDKFKGKCEPFNPGECGANENSFRTETECQMQCTGNRTNYLFYPGKYIYTFQTSLS